MRFVKISFFYFFFTYAVKGSYFDDNFWQLEGAFFVHKRCCISMKDTRKESKSSVANSSMVVLDCAPFIPKPQNCPPFKQDLKRQHLYRYIACYNTFYERQKKYRTLILGELCEVDLLNDSDFRAIVIPALEDHMEKTDNFLTSILMGRILDILGAERP